MCFCEPPRLSPCVDVVLFAYGERRKYEILFVFGVHTKVRGICFHVVSLLLTSVVSSDEYVLSSRLLTENTEHG